MKIGLAIAIRREELNLTQEQVADFVGVSKSSVCRWESGDINNMKRDRIERLAQILQVNPTDLLYDEIDCFHKIDEKKQPTEKQAAAIDKIKNMSPDELQQAEVFLDFIISKREDPVDE